MKKFLLWACALMLLPMVFASCEEKKEEGAVNYWEEYANWRKANQAFFERSMPRPTLWEILYMSE